MDPQEGARVTDSSELPHLGAKPKSRGLTHVMRVHTSSENNQRRKQNQTLKSSGLWRIRSQLGW